MASFIQNVGSTNQNATTSSITIPAGGIATGELIIVRIAANNSSYTISSLTDSRSNTYTEIGSVVTNGTTRMFLYYASVTTALQAGDTINLTVSAKVNHSMIADQFSGITTTQDFTAVTGTGTSTTPSTSAQTPTQGSVLLIGQASYSLAAGNDATEDSDSAGGDSWHTLTFLTASSKYNWGAYKIATSTASQTYNITIPSSVAWTAKMAGFRYSAGANLTQDVNDSVTPSDAQTFGFGRGIADTLSLADALVFERQLVIPDTLSLADALALGRELVLPDTLSLSDSITAERGLVVNIDDSVSPSDSLTGFGYGRTLDDLLDIADAFKFDRTMLLADAAGLADAIALGMGLGLSDSVTPSDSLATESGRGIDDSITVADALRFDRGMTLADAATLSDAIAFSRGLGLSDTLSLVDALRFDFGLSVADSVALADALAFDFQKVLTETVDLADNLAFEGVGGQTKNIDDSIAVTDAISIGFARTLTDSVGVADSLARQLNGLFISDGAGGRRYRRLMFRHFDIQ